MLQPSKTLHNVFPRKSFHRLSKQKIKEHPTLFEKTFYPDQICSLSSILWLEKEALERGIHIHHALCGHGGERMVEDGFVDGFHFESNTVFEFYGCYWHGCPKCYPNDRDKIVNNNNEARDECLARTKNKAEKMRNPGYTVVEKWQCDAGDLEGVMPKKKTKVYPHAIFFDIETYGDKSFYEKRTEMFTIENAQTAISVSLADTLNPTPTHICDKNPKKMVERFFHELRKRGQEIRDEVKKEFLPSDFMLLPKKKKRRSLINKWVNQVPVLGFNSGNFDLNVMNEFLVEKICETTDKPVVCKNGKKVMFVKTDEFRFLDVMNYTGPGVSYDKWVKAYGCESTKSWMPYYWFDCPEKLDFQRLPEYSNWFSKLKGDYVLTLDEQKKRRIFHFFKGHLQLEFIFR